MQPAAPRRFEPPRGGARAIVPAMPPDPVTSRSAVVLSGGGSNGAYEIGVLKALYAGNVPFLHGRPPLRADIFTGTSVGSYNATFLAQHEDVVRAVDELEAIWRQRIAASLDSCGNGIYRLRPDPVRFLDPGCLRNPLRLLAEAAGDAVFWGGYALAYGQQFLASDAPFQDRMLQSINVGAAISRQPLESLLRETIDLDRLRRSPNDLAVVVSDWQNAKPVIYQKADLADRLGTEIILASTAIPGVFAPVLLDGVPCVDGGLLMNTPIKPAVDAGAVVLHVIYTDPYISEIPLPPLPNTVSAFSRLYGVLVAAQFNADVRHAAVINEEIAEAAGRGAGAAAAASELPAVRAHRAVGAERAEGRGRAAAGEHLYRPLEIHRYRPAKAHSAATDFLDFSAEVVDQLIEQGYRETLVHDCEHAECVIPTATEAAPRDDEDNGMRSRRPPAADVRRQR